MNTDQKKIYSFIKSYKKEYAIFPSVKTIKDQLFMDYNKVWYQMNRLCKIGFLKKYKYGTYEIISKNRNLIPTGRAEAIAIDIHNGKKDVVQKSISNFLKQAYTLCWQQLKEGAMTGNNQQVTQSLEMLEKLKKLMDSEE